ncbi:MAG: GGDEF domain-containing protein [Acidobacteria bacterium]|nr:GGDEF domain-containing protein [Acidobacteriota bacterium]
MRLKDGNDLFLLVGVWVALFVIVSRPLGRLISLAFEANESYGQQLLSALVILAVVLTVHQMRKRHEARIEAQASAAAAEQAVARATEMGNLVKFGQALGESLTLDSIADVSAKHFPLLSGGRPAWALIRSGAAWRRLAMTGGRSFEACEKAARIALGDTGAGASDPHADICFPMIAAGEAVGVFGVGSEPALSEVERASVAGVAPLLAVSVKNAQRFNALLESTVHDGLTGCANRAHAMAVIDGELNRSRRTKLPLALIMFDLDRFKEINDKFGHLCGDAVLSAVGKRMSGVLRGSDLKCRYGGEEFLVLLPDTGLAGAQRVAELLRHDLAERPVPWNEHSVRITASFGVTAVSPGELDVTSIIARADAALYRAKADGRNCVSVDGGQGAIESAADA